jgi:acetolactate synthase I/II/III large subunit
LQVTSKTAYTGADLIADFIEKHLCKKVFLVTGGACAFIVDAIGRKTDLEYVCFQHEQSAAMAADAVWRTTGKIGVTVATSGPGATNLITGIACSWFDSIPSFHITGQVNEEESREFNKSNARQIGFQETDIVSMVSGITKWAHKVKNSEDLVDSLIKALEQALDGRMGPVLLDVPMNIQKMEISENLMRKALGFNLAVEIYQPKIELNLASIFEKSLRPLVVIGAGLGLSQQAKNAQDWCEKFQIPYVTSWGGLTHIEREKPNYFGSIGVYGNRKANFVTQSADKIIVLGSRLDNRQRTGNPKAFAPFAEIHVFDIDKEELSKFENEPNYIIHHYDLRNFAELTLNVIDSTEHVKWVEQLKNINLETGFKFSTKENELNPYESVKLIQEKVAQNAIVVSDCGANLCWVYQAFEPSSSYLFTAGGNSPMGYSLPAAIGAQLLNPESQVICFIGDGGLQMNLQELQTITSNQLPIKIFIQNNNGYGIIKQFQDANFSSRYFASGDGYTTPDFAKIADAYGIAYYKITTIEEVKKLSIKQDGAVIYDLIHPQNALITPKTETDHFIHDQFPYINDGSNEKLPYKYPNKPSTLV